MLDFMPKGIQQRLDTRAEGAAGRVDSAMAPLREVNRSEK